MLDSSRREVLVSAVVNSTRDVVSGVMAAFVVRLTGIEALESDDTDADADAADD
jgi:hypothetical protein